MSRSHPRRSQRSNALGHIPTAAEASQLLDEIREERQMTWEELSADLLVTRDALQKWRSGARNMPAAVWEYLCLQQAYPEVERARKLWRQGRPF
jgi:DNA-binding transcriptional regulator YiaG